MSRAAATSNPRVRNDFMAFSWAPTAGLSESLPWAFSCDYGESANAISGLAYAFARRAELLLYRRMADNWNGLGWGVFSELKAPLLVDLVAAPKWLRKKSFLFLCERFAPKPGATRWPSAERRSVVS